MRSGYAQYYQSYQEAQAQSFQPHTPHMAPSYQSQHSIPNTQPHNNPHMNLRGPENPHMSMPVNTQQMHPQLSNSPHQIDHQQHHFTQPVNMYPGGSHQQGMSHHQHSMSQPG